MKRILSIAVLLLVSAFTAAAWILPTAEAELTASAVYSGSDEAGVIAIQAAPMTPFQVFAELPDGSLAQLCAGMVPNSGSAWIGAVPTGVLGNGMPMFMVRVWDSSGDSLWLSVPISESDDYLWGWL